MFIANRIQDPNMKNIVSENSKNSPRKGKFSDYLTVRFFQKKFCKLKATA